MIDQAIGDFESLGAHTKRVRVPNYEVVHIANSIIYLVEGFNIYRKVLRARAEDVGEVFRLYGLFTADEYVQAMRLRTRCARHFSECRHPAFFGDRCPAKKDHRVRPFCRDPADPLRGDGIVHQVGLLNSTVLVGVTMMEAVPPRSSNCSA